MIKYNLDPVFAQLREVMLNAAGSMQATVDEAGRLEMHASWAHPTKPGTQMWFGAVRMGKAYVSYHLMPVYTHPKLAEAVDPALRRRMQGKSCFNFTSLDPALMTALKALTRECARAYAKPFQTRAP